MWDNLTALQPSTVKEAKTVLFLRKLPRHIRNLIHARAFKEPEDLIQHCNEIWGIRPRKRPPKPRPPRGLTLLSEAPAALPLRSAGVSPHRGRPETAEMIACVSTTPASIPRPRSARRAAPTRKTNRQAASPYTAAAAGPIATCLPPPFPYRNQPQPCLPYLQRT